MTRMNKASASIWQVLVITGLYSANAFGQAAPPPLIDFVTDSRNAATQLQINAGTAVQRACGALIAQAGGVAEAFTLPGKQGDLFARCNELVQTADVLQGTQATPQTRDLQISQSELLATIQQVAGEELLGQTTLSTRVTNGQFTNIAGRLNALRLGGASAALGGRVAAIDPDEPDRNAMSYASLSEGSRIPRGGAASGDIDISGSRLGWFLEGSFNTGDRDQSANEDGFDFDSTSFTLGLDYILDSGVIGISFGVDNYQADFENAVLVSGGDIEVEGTSGSVFGAFYRGNFYLDSIISFGNLDTDTTRIVQYASNNPMCMPVACPGENDVLAGETDGDFLAGGATLGFDFVRGNWDISTTLSVAYRDIDIDGYTETDGDPNGGLELSFSDQTIESLRSILGVSFTGNFSRDFGVLSPQLRAEWHHEFEDTPQVLIAKYAVEQTLTVPGAAGPGVFSLNPSSCISCFAINSDEIDTDFALVGVGLSAVFSRRIQLYGAIDTLLGLEDISSTSFSIGIRGQF